jgi:uncharacterized protein (UPF0264 family)
MPTVSALVANTANQAKAECHVAAVSTGGRDGKSLVDKIKGGSYSSEQFASLTSDKKQRV